MYQQNSICGEFHFSYSIRRKGIKCFRKLTGIICHQLKRVNNGLDALIVVISTLKITNIQTSQKRSKMKLIIQPYLVCPVDNSKARKLGTLRTNTKRRGNPIFFFGHLLQRQPTETMTDDRYRLQFV